jgi:hypothetical protein
MNRREALRLLAAGIAMPLAPRSLLALREARTMLGASAAPRTLSAHQFATARSIAELIIPRTDTPGATDVGTAEFIDLILTEWYDNDDRNMFMRGLSDVDSQSRSLFGKTFVDVTSSQQGDILTALGKQLVEETDSSREDARQLRAERPHTHRHFYAMFRSLTLTAFYTSEAGATQELHFQMIPGSYEGCVSPQTTPSNKEASGQQ